MLQRGEPRDAHKEELLKRVQNVALLTKERLLADFPETDLRSALAMFDRRLVRKGFGDLPCQATRKFLLRGVRQVAAALGCDEAAAAMSFNRAESTNATSGYWRYVGDWEKYRKNQEKGLYQPRLQLNGTDRAVASLDHDWLLAQARAMDHQPDDAGDDRPETPPPAGYGLCADIIARPPRGSSPSARAK